MERPNIQKLVDEINKSQKPRSLALALALILQSTQGDDQRLPDDEIKLNEIKIINV